ncbi:hypothetical protein KW798_03590 [Candidatus Parcubacteria bacterium]|nr:hypothetical protein [Candidatus Parcubacteria bacterium]
MPIPRRSVNNGFDQAAWRRSAFCQAMLEKLRTFKPGDRVLVHGVKAEVAKTDEKTLTVMLTIGKVTQGYSVKAVEFDPARQK